MITNFGVSAGELTTETRVLLTDEQSRRAFAATGWSSGRSADSSAGAGWPQSCAAPIWASR
jgi:hypothetical protein